MKNVIESIKTALELTEFASARAKQILMANGCQYRVNFDGIEFSEYEINVKFEESIKHDNPNHDSVTLALEFLQMSDDDWNSYIEGITSRRLALEKKHKDGLEKEQRKQKEAEFLRLKKELGH